MADDRGILIEQLIVDEGLKLKPYMDLMGKITIGVGRNLSDVGLTEDEAMTLLDHDVDACVADLASFAWFPTLDAVRQITLVNMRFNLGPTRFRNFGGMLQAMADKDYPAAAKAMRNSLWASQVPARAERLIQQMRTGQLS